MITTMRMITMGWGGSGSGGEELQQGDAGHR